jgi:hypothetical protein
MKWIKKKIRKRRKNLKSKLSTYILDEDRNINSDVSSIKKMVKGYMNKTKQLRADLFDNMGKKAIGMTKNVTENEMEDFKYQLRDWITKSGELDISNSFETIIDAVIEKKY